MMGHKYSDCLRSLVGRLVPTLVCTVAAGWPLQAQVSDSQFRADSLNVLRALAEADSATPSDSARRAEVLAALETPVRFRPRSEEPDSAGERLLAEKAWYLYLNPRLQVTLTGYADAGLAPAEARKQSRGRVDEVRALLAGRGVAENQIRVEEPAGPAPDSLAGTLTFDFSGTLEQLDVPPPDADPPEAERTAGLAAGGRQYRWGVVRVYYATDRARSGRGDPEGFYGPERTSDGSLELGRLEVTIPRVHREGIIERPAWYRIDQRPNPDRHLILRSVTPLGQQATLDSIRKTVRASGSREALVFIHGYNVTFHEAALRTAQLTYDLGFDGAPILYSWPSRGSLFHYASDREAAEWSAAHLRRFLDSIVAITGARKLNVIAHSMGNRALTLALQGDPTPDTVFSNLVLAAPDVDADLFAQQLAAAIRPLTERLTVYMSSQDKALRLSRWLSTHRRLGEATKPMLVVKSIDTIDASELDTDLLGHGYIASNRDIIDDLVALVGEKKSPPRTRLRRASIDGQTYWVLP